MNSSTSKLNQVSRKWQAEVEALNTEASTMYKNYQNEVVFLSQEQKKAKQDANIIRAAMGIQIDDNYLENPDFALKCITLVVCLASDPRIPLIKPYLFMASA